MFFPQLRRLLKIREICPLIIVTTNLVVASDGYSFPRWSIFLLVT